MLHLWFYCLLLSLLAHNGLTNCFPLKAPSNHGWGSGSHYERAANGQRSDVYQRLLEQRAAVCHTNTCWGPLPVTNHNSYTYRQSLYIKSVSSQWKQENTGKHTEDYNVWQPQNLNGTHQKRKSKTRTDSLFPHSWMSTKAWDIAQGSFNVLNSTVYFCKIITVKAVLPTGAPRRSLSVWWKLYNRSFSWASLSREGQGNSTDNDMFWYCEKQTCV